MTVHLRLDADYFPLITVVFPRDGCSDEDVDHMMARFEELIERNEPYAIIVDGGGVKSAPNPRQRKRLVEWESSRAAAIRRLNKGSALVVDSALTRGVITAMRWVSAPVSPEAVYATPGEAGRWCIRQLESAGVEVPTKTQEFVASLERIGPGALRGPLADAASPSEA